MRVSVLRLQTALRFVILASCAASCTPRREVRDSSVARSALTGVSSNELTAEDLRRESASIVRFAGPDPVAPPEAIAPARDLPPLPAVNSDAPPGAAHHKQTGDGQLVSVTAPEERRLRNTPKPGRHGAQPAPPSQQPIELRLGGEVRTLKPGLDTKLRNTTPIPGERDYTYAFLFLDEYMSEALERELAEAGVQIIGPHGVATKVRVPLEPLRLDKIAAQRNVLALTYAPSDQKIEPRVRAAAQKFSGELDALPVIVNAFDEAALNEIVRWLKPMAQLGRPDLDLLAVPAVVPISRLDELAKLNAVLSVELSVPTRPAHDESMPVMGVDYIRPTGTDARYSGAPIILGILDSGFMMSPTSPPRHDDLPQASCGIDYTGGPPSVWNDRLGHGTSVLVTAIGTGSADARYKGAAPGVGSSAAVRVRVAKIWDTGEDSASSAMKHGMDFMVSALECSSGVPQVVNLSGGADASDMDSDALARKVDALVWTHRQTWVVSAGNERRGQTVRSPALAKNVITVGNVVDRDGPFDDTGRIYTTGELYETSSQGPTKDGRLKPNVVATGTYVTSARAGTQKEYTGNLGTSMAAPHISGIAATLMEHYPEFIGAPQLLRAHLMATALQHDSGGALSNTELDKTGKRYAYGLGRASPYLAHWDHPNPNGWTTARAVKQITNTTWGYLDLNVPQGAGRLVVVMTWDEPPASAGTGVAYDLDLYVDGHSSGCDPLAKACGEWSSNSDVDNVEYVILDKPTPGPYRIKIANWSAPSTGLPAAIAALIVNGSTDPGMQLSLGNDSAATAVGGTVSVETTLSSSNWILSAGYLQATLPAGVQLESLSLTRPDGTLIEYENPSLSALAMGTIPEGRSQRATWKLRVNSPGPLPIYFRATAENSEKKDAVFE
ncbi:MAG: hypothetical protein RL685_6695, partial [Pseudomonadota bacterium]